MNRIYIVIISVLLCLTVVECTQLRNLKEEASIAEANVKAYSNELSLSKQRNIAYQLTVDQLKYFNDSIFRAMDSVRRELKIKDSKLKSLQYVTSDFSKSDTVIFRDTIFSDPAFNVDTLIGDAWYSVALHLHYPSVITVEPEFKSEKYIIVSRQRETVNSPKKFFLFRWFQKKHTVLQVNVIERNPYTEGEINRFVEIIN